MLSTGVLFAILAVSLIAYGLLFKIKNYVRISPYINGALFSIFWFMASDFGRGLAFPSIIDNEWINFAAFFVLLQVFIFIFMHSSKVTASLIISLGSLSFLFLTEFLAENTYEIEDFARASAYLIVAVVTLIIGCCVVIKTEINIRGKGWERIPTCIILGFIPFVTIYFVLSVLEPEKSTLECILYAGIPSLIFMGIYNVIDSVLDKKYEVRSRIEKEQLLEKSQKVQERLQARMAISYAIEEQLAQIEEGFNYFRDNPQNRNLLPERMTLFKNLYAEAMKLKSAYDGTADGDVLRRFVEIRKEIQMIVGEFKIAAENRAKSGKQQQNNAYNDSKRQQNNGYGDGNRHQNNTYKDARQEEGNGYAGNASKPSDEALRSEIVSNFFKGCNDRDEIKKRYRDLCKVYHPDSECGDVETFVLIKEEYERLLDRL